MTVPSLSVEGSLPTGRFLGSQVITETGGYPQGKVPTNDVAMGPRTLSSEKDPWSKLTFKDISSWGAHSLPASRFRKQSKLTKKEHEYFHESRRTGSWEPE